MGGVLNRPVLPSAADGEHIPERDEQRAQNLHAEFDEDTMRRWVSIATFGVILFVTAVVTAARLPVVAGSSVLPYAFIFFGVAELFVGTFVAYVAYPPAIGWVALACAFTIAAGVAVGVGGTAALWGVVWVFLVLGLGCAAVGLWRGVVSWNEIRRDELGPSPS